MRTISQKVSEYALECISDIESKKFAGKYKSYIKSFPALVISEGLLMALAFTLSKSNLKDNGKDGKGDKDARKMVFVHIANWLEERNVISVSNPEEEYEKVIEELSKMDVRKYRLATQEALKVADWLRRFAEGLIKDEEGGGDT